MRGPCAKRQVRCIITAVESTAQFVGENDCANPQGTCPREPGEGYEKCQSICQQSGHAEAEAVKAAGDAARGGSAQLWGHYWMCEPCGRALRDAGVVSVTVYLAL
jgi:deoxycytidylate deaminase